MKHDYNLKSSDREALRSLVGKRLVSYRLNMTDNVSYEVFVFRLEDEDVEVRTHEIVGTDDFFNETNTIEVLHRPNRDSWSGLGASDPADGIGEGQFKDYDVGRVIQSVSVVVEKFGGPAGDGEFVRGIVLGFGEDSLVFDKGSPNWSDIWRVTAQASSKIAFDVEDFSPNDEPYSVSVRVERIG